MFARILGALALCLSAAALAAPDIPYASLINKAGRQRMLSQRIVKAYCQVGLGVMPGDSAELLRDSVQLFERQLAELKQYATTPELKASVAREEEEWQAFRALALRPVSSGNAEKLQVRSESLLRAAHELTQLYEAQMGQPRGKLVNLSGRQRMLSQRIAKLYLLKQWGLTKPEHEQQLGKARDEFQQAMKTLEQAPENNDSVRRELSLAETQWIFFSGALGQQGSAGDGRRNVATTSERILEVLDNVASRYEKLQ